MLSFFQEEEDAEELVSYDPKDGNKEVYRGPANHILIVELKSIKNKNYEKVPKTKPKKEHEMQLQLYFYLMGIRKGLVYYENKDTQESKYFVVKYNGELMNQVISEIKKVIEYSNRRELPAREGTTLDIMCHYCDFRNTCHLPVSEEEWQDLYFNEGEASN
ncbi:PD-(D/E)XK nuclease family protein [Bacillus sp. 165]|uniref:PD-(D/E)XK nuclease family protein n=1 Tax=Bacillus sp. 165 TaxID=1529117 RepID=UPI001ADC0887|nr:Dna2/Cas4 domain-containing protein [Bacillus sp. 165]